MSPKIFSITDREELRVKMLDAGFELIKQYGMTHARWRRSPKPPAGQEHLLQLLFLQGGICHRHHGVPTGPGEAAF